MISNLIFHCNNCDANTASVTIRESTAAAPSSLLNAKFTFKGTPPPITRPMNALQLYRWQFSHEETLWQTVFKQSAILKENGRFAFLSFPLRGLGQRTYTMFILGVVDFLVVLIELFSLGVTAEELRAK